MKFILQPLIAVSVLLCFCPSPSQAEDTFGEPALTVAIPDNSPQGIVRSTTVSGLDTALRYSLRVGLRIGGTGLGGYLGDLYGYLSHASLAGEYRMAVLMNRPGRSFSQPSGYDESGLDVIFSAAADHDFHVYRQHHPTIVDGRVYGEWQPDARAVSPYEVTEDSPRSAGFESLEEIDPNGDWYLFLADLESGGTMQLEAWYLEFTPFPAVPEPRPLHYMIFVAALSALLVHRRTRRR